MTMTGTLVPHTTQVAAKRGFIRTATQALGAALPTVTITGAVLSEADPATIAWSAGAAVVSSLLAGLASYLSITSNGIPDDYADAALADEQPTRGRHAA